MLLIRDALARSRAVIDRAAAVGREGVQGIGFLAELAWQMRRPLDEGAAAAILARRLRERERDFLGLLRLAVYGHPASPYLRLMRTIGCELGDVERLIAAEGLEGALASLLRNGVYLSVDEVKGRVPVVRGSSTFRIGPEDLQNPVASGSLRARTSGSRGRASVVSINVAHNRAIGVDQGLTLAARGGAGWAKGLWSVPGGAAIAALVDMSTLGNPAERWFTPVALDSHDLDGRYRWSAQAVHLASWAAGRRLPRPRHAPLEDPEAVVHWMQTVLARGGTPHLQCGVSAAVRLSQAALARGRDLEGAQFSVGGEPVTAHRLATIRESGATAVPYYASMEAGMIAQGCLEPVEADDMHLLTDLHVAVPGTGDNEGRATLYLTSLRRTARLVLVNAAIGDEAHLGQRRCGCAMEERGWATHVSRVGSSHKVTIAGMTFHDEELNRLLDEGLPARLGGGPTDYQLLEEEGADGRGRLTLRVHPRVGPLHEEAVAAAFMAELASDGGAASVMAAVWRDAAVLRVVREAPSSTATGKILHHVRAAASLSRA